MREVCPCLPALWLSSGRGPRGSSSLAQTTLMYPPSQHLSEKAKGKQRAIDVEPSPNAGPSSSSSPQPVPSEPATRELVIRFTEGAPDLTVSVNKQDTVRDIKRRVRFSSSGRVQVLTRVRSGMLDQNLKAGDSDWSTSVVCLRMGHSSTHGSPPWKKSNRGLQVLTRVKRQRQRHHRDRRRGYTALLGRRWNLERRTGRRRNWWVWITG